MWGLGCACVLAVGTVWLLVQNVSSRGVAETSQVNSAPHASDFLTRRYYYVTRRSMTSNVLDCAIRLQQLQHLYVWDTTVVIVVKQIDYAYEIITITCKFSLEDLN